MITTAEHRKKKITLIQWLMKKSIGRFTLSILGVMAFIALLAPNIAYHPVSEHSISIFPLIPFNPEDIDTAVGTYSPPLSKGYAIHWLGTDNIGRDVAAIIVHGTRSSLMIACAVAVLSTILGICAGALAGFWGNRGLRLSVSKALCYTFSVLAAIFWGVYVRRFKIADAFKGEGSLLLELSISILIISSILAVSFMLTRMSKGRAKHKTFFLPVDACILTLMDLIVSIPTMILVICLVAVLQPSAYLIVAIISLNTWPETARLVRSEILYLKQSTFVDSTRTTGIPEAKTLWCHILPNAFTPVYAAFAFSASNALLIESGLSFLRIGASADQPGWGSLIAQVVAYPSAWHLAIAPGAALLLVITSLNIMGELLQQYFNPKHKIL